MVHHITVVAIDNFWKATCDNCGWHGNRLLFPLYAQQQGERHVRHPRRKVDP